MPVLAVDIGGTQYRLAVVNRKGELLHHYRGRTRREEGARWLLPRLQEELKNLLNQVDDKPLGIGVGFGGPVDFPSQKILASLHAPGWEEADLAGALGGELGLPCVVDNDANLGCLGEYTYGAGRGWQSLLYYTVSTGVGGGVVVNSRLLRGSHSQGGELGHIPVSLEGPPCTCGFRGCVESLCSGLAIARQAREALEGGAAETKLREILQVRGELTAKDVFECAAGGDELSLSILAKVRQAFAHGLIAAINCFDPQAVVVGGGVGLAQGFLDGLEELVNASLVIPGRRRIPILRGSLGDNSVLLGAASLAFQEFGD